MNNLHRKILLFFFLCYSYTTFSHADVIVESRSGGQNFLYYSETGIKWQNSTSKSTAQGLTAGIGARFCDLQNDSNARDTARFAPPINTSGSYQVNVTWNLGNASTVRYQVFNAGGLQTTIYLLQDGYGQQGPSNANQWISIGTFSFSSGTTGRVEVSSANANGVPGPSGNYRVYSDAVKWVYAGTPIAPVAACTAIPTTGLSPLTVNFTDNSLNNPTAWAWTFGDGSTDIVENPVHTYSATTESYYTLQLIVSNSAGTSTTIMTNYIHVTVPSAPFPMAIDSVTHGGIIVDNDDAGFTFSGGWSLSTQFGEWADSYYQINAQLSNSSNATVRWTPTLPSASQYNVYVWYPSTTNQVIDAHYSVHYSEGQQSFYVNQTVNYAGWFYLGNFNFDSGNNDYIELTNATRTTAGSYTVAADAILLEPINQIIVDDGSDFGGSFQQYGAWAITNNPPYYYSTSARYISVVTSGFATASTVWQPNLPLNGIYRVDIAYPSIINGQSLAKDASFTVGHKNGTETITVPQNFHGYVNGNNHWYELGTFAFNSGTSGYVMLNNLAPLSNGRVVTADAVRFTTYSPIPVYEGGEFRAFWAHGLGVPGLLNITQVSAMVDTARLYNFNAIIAHGRCAGDAYYDSAFEGKCSALGSNTTFDSLSALIMLAHDTSGGKRYIEVHSWLNPYRDYDSGLPPIDTSIHIRYTETTWWDQTNSGVTTDGGAQYSNPSIPDNQDYHIKVWMDVVRNYDIDGVHTDDYFYQDSIWGFNSIATSLFAAEYGYAPNSGDGNFSNWRRQGVTNYVRRFYAEALTVKPHLKWSIAPVASSSMTPYLSSDAYSSEFNDWLGWYTNHYIDALIPEVYTGAYNSTFTSNLIFSTASAKAYNRHLYYGQGSDQATTPTNISMIYYSQLTAHTHGSVLFDYTDLNNTSNNLAFLQAVVTTAFSNPTSTAAMPWKSNPPGGILKGTLYSSATNPYPYFNGKAVYKALVTYSGPYGFGTCLSDGSGYYMMMDVPYGTYTVTAYIPPGNTAVSMQVANVGITRGVSTNVNLNFDIPLSTKDWFKYGEKKR